MAVLPIIIAPDPRLEICSEPVDKVTDETRKLMDDMLETMYHSEGIGLAAVQIGVHKRIIVIDLQDAAKRHNVKTTGEPYYFVNPEIVDTSDQESEFEEGCLSFPDQQVLISRPASVAVKYLDYDGNPQTLQCEGLLATCIQHEIDHLNGVVIVDHASKMKRDMVMRKLAKIKKKIAKGELRLK